MSGDVALLAKLAGSTLWDEDVHFGTHLQVWGSWYDAEQKAWGYACCRSLDRKRRRCPSTPGGPAEGAAEAEEEPEVKVTRRLADLLERCPAFTGEVPTPEQERDWTIEELSNFVFSNGLIRPARKRGSQRAEPSAADWKELDLKEGSDADTVKKAYKKLALKHHPDKQHGASEEERATASRRFQRLAEAYEAICGHVAEVPALPASEAVRRRWRLVVVED